MRFIGIVQHVRQRAELIVGEQAAAEIDRLRTQAGHGRRCFENHVDEFGQLESAESYSPLPPVITRRIHAKEYSIFGIEAHHAS